MPTWNKQQLAAIQTKQKNILVSASAGSGKTTVLVARLMDLVLNDHVGIDEILAMTFTEAAANEMKKRLAKELQDAYNTATLSETKAFLSKQLSSLENALICTIHAFCLTIIQKYYYMINLDHERVIHIMDNGAMDLFQTQAIEQAMSIQYKKQDTPFIQLCQMFSSRPEDENALRDMIKQLAVLASSKPEPEHWLSSLTIPYHTIHHITDLPDVITDNFFDYLNVQIERYQEAILHINKIYQLVYPTETKKMAAVKAKIEALPTLFQTLRDRDYEAFRIAFQNICHGLIPSSPEKDHKEYVQTRKKINDIEDHLLGLLFSEHQFINDLSSLYPMSEKLVELTKDYRTFYEALKEKHQQIDFDDMEHFALAILDANQQEVAKRYQKQFRQIMVDEFQDSNDVQNALVMRICKKDNVFRVGDIKQSIYGFRHAKPQLMRSLIEHADIYDQVIYLSNNYRSKDFIVEFNNLLFKQLMNVHGFDSRYENEDDVEIGLDVQKQDHRPIMFHAIYHDEIKQQTQLFTSKNDLKASYIAHQILEIKQKEKRSWNEFVVLVRSNARKDLMKRVFDELHIPYYIDIKYGFYQSSAVQTMLSALESIYAPHKDIPFVATLLSPLIHITDDTLAQCKLVKEKHQSYYAYFCEHPFPAFEVFQNLRKKRNIMRLSDMLNALYQLNDYYQTHTNVQEKTNLDLLFDKAIQFEEANASGIPSFLSMINRIKGAQTAEAIPIGQDANVVRVMSIHQSKGLQFPVVFLWSTDRMTPIEFKDFCIADADLGIAMKAMQLPERFIRTTLLRIAIEHKKDREELAEEMRILYVATTRAQQQMHIVDCVLSCEEYQRKLTMSGVYDRKGYTSWILQCFLTNPCKLFQIIEVHQQWHTEPLLQEHMSEALSIPLYQNTATSMHLSSATAINQVMNIPSFQPNNNAYANHGSDIHKLIEHLPKTVWTKQTMYRTAKSLHISLHEQDIENLEALYHNTHFQHMLQSDCHHELPFTVKKENEILHGFMDFVCFEKHVTSIIDFKNDHVTSKQLLIDRYAQQLQTYRQAMLILYPQTPCAIYIYSLPLQSLIPITE